MWNIIKQSRITFNKFGRANDDVNESESHRESFLSASESTYKFKHYTWAKYVCVYVSSIYKHAAPRCFFFIFLFIFPLDPTKTRSLLNSEQYITHDEKPVEWTNTRPWCVHDSNIRTPTVEFVYIYVYVYKQIVEGIFKYLLEYTSVM